MGDGSTVPLSHFEALKSQKLAQKLVTIFKLYSKSHFLSQYEICGLERRGSHEANLLADKLAREMNEDNLSNGCFSVPIP